MWTPMSTERRKKQFDTKKKASLHTSEQGINESIVKAIVTGDTNPLNGVLTEMV